MKAADFRRKNSVNIVADAGNGSPATGAYPTVKQDLK